MASVQRCLVGLSPIAICDLTSLAFKIPGFPITWRNRLPTLGCTGTSGCRLRTYAAYRLALTGDVQEVARQTGFPESLISLAFTGLVAHQDALLYFDLSPRTCRRHNWDQEVAQWLDWHTGRFLFGASLAVVPAGVPIRCPVRWRAGYCCSDPWLEHFSVRQFLVTVRTTWSGGPSGSSA